MVTLSATSDVTINLSPTTPTDTATAFVSVATNNTTGYTLFIQSGCAFDATGNLAAGTCTSDNRLKKVGSAMGSLNPADYMNPIAANTLTDNTWGYQFNVSTPGGSNWSPAPTTVTALVSTNTANSGSSSLSAGTPDDYDVFYGARVSPGTAMRTYKGEVVWTVVANF